MSLAPPESAPARVDGAPFIEKRRSACADGSALLPRLADLGVHLAADLPRVGAATGAVLHLDDDRWIVGFPAELDGDSRERLLRALFAQELGIEAERPLVITQRDKEAWGPFFTWCPLGCITDHTDDIRRGTALEDLCHDVGPAVSTSLSVWSAEHGTEEVRVLAGQICVQPYAQDARRTLPHVSLEVFQDEWMESLGPDELGQVIADLRAHLDALEDLRDRLVQARAQYRRPNS